MTLYEMIVVRTNRTLMEIFGREVNKMKVIRNVSAETAANNLEVAASEKFVANETASSCLCRCSDG